MADVKRVVVYGNPAGGTTPVVSNLTTDNVEVNYAGFGLDVGTVQVTIKDYDFKFSVPLVGKKIPMPKYTTTLTGESAGTLPTPSQLYKDLYLEVINKHDAATYIRSTQHRTRKLQGNPSSVSC